jgi:hypothetical protein
MDTLSIIITLVSVIASVLQIVLFFKVWQMCNDVKVIRKVQNHEAPTADGENKKDDGSVGMLVLLAVVIIIIVVFFTTQVI